MMAQARIFSNYELFFILSINSWNLDFFKLSLLQLFLDIICDIKMLELFNKRVLFHFAKLLEENLQYWLFLCSHTYLQ